MESVKSQAIGSNFKENAKLGESVKLAIDLFSTFYGNLMGAVVSSIRNFEGGMYGNIGNANNVYYYMGKRDAFNEISERIRKEFDLARQPLVNGQQARTIYEIKERIRSAKNNDADTLFPDTIYRGRNGYNEVERLKRNLANLFECYAMEGFGFGRLYEGKRIKRRKCRLRKHQPLSQVPEFNPMELYDAMYERFIPDNYKEAIESMDSARN